MADQIKIRHLTVADGAAAAQIFHDAVHLGTARFYTLEQRTAWAGKKPNTEGWSNKFSETFGFAADLEQTLVGFMTLDADGYLDLAFVSPRHSGNGIGTALYSALELHAVKTDITKITTEASTAAKPFFQHLGFGVDAEQNVVKHGVTLQNFTMSKAL